MLEVRALKALERIADALEGLRRLVDEMTMPDPDPEPEPTGCSHPLDQRLPFGRTNGVEDWQCKLCGYRVSEVLHA